MQVIYDDTCSLCNGFRTWIERRESGGSLEFVDRLDQSRRTNSLSLELLPGDGTKLLGVPAVLTAIGHTGGLLGAIARRLNRKPVHRLLAPRLSINCGKQSSEAQCILPLLEQDYPLAYTAIEEKAAEVAMRHMDGAQ